MTGIGQPAVNAGYTVKRFCVAAFAKIVTACHDRTDDVKKQAWDLICRVVEPCIFFGGFVLCQLS